MTTNPDNAKNTASDEPAGLDPSTSPAPELTKGQLRYLKRKEYMREYARKNGHKRNTGRPPGRRPKPKETEPARPKNYNAVWAPQYKEDGTPGPQFALLSCPFPEIFFGGARGGGKGSSMDSMVMTPFGWREMRELRLGQAVCNPDGSVCHIIGIYPLGERQLYRVTFHDGTSTEVTDDHIWLTWKSNKAQKSKGVRQFGQDSARLWTTRAMMDDMKTERNVKQNFLIPVTQPVTITDVSRYPRRPIPPYLLGVLLGDGYLSDHTIRYTKADREIAGIIDDALEKYGFTQRLTGPYEYEGKCVSWGLSVSADSELIHHLRKLELIGTRSLTKFIPEPYLLGTVAERWELLRGLMDTDGWAEEDGDIYFGTSSPRLRDDTTLLARSLGAVVTVREKEPNYTYKGEALQGQTSWTLRIKLRTPSEAFHLERKKARCLRPPQSMFRMIVSIEQSRTAESQCIQVSHPNGLYLTNDYIVTHNTDGAIGKWLQHANRYGPDAKGVFFRRRFKQLEEVQSRCSALFPPLGATYHKGDATWIFPNKAVLKLRHLWDVAATEEYQGHSYSFLVFEEVTNWSTPDAIDRMRGTLRSAKGAPVELIMTGNPGGSGHCVPYGEVLTPSGWKDISHVEVGDPVMTVTDKGEIVQSEASQIHKSRYTGMMAAISQNGVTIVCTPNHKIGIVNSSKTKIALKPFNELGSGFSIPRVLISQGKETRLDESGRSELHITAEAVKMLDYDGDVYCIGVPQTHSFIVRQNGFVWVSGNSWVKQRYISPAPQGWTPIKDEETGAYRIYIPSRLEDNTAMMKNDPTYAARLRGTGSAALVNAWLKGDWDIVAGGFFDDLIVPDTHFLTPFHIPSTWSYRRSFDWGSASPASLGIWAVSDGNPVPDLDGFTFPRGSLIRIKEWYTCAKTKTGDIVPNEGLRLTNLALGEGIAQRSLGYRFGGCVADPSIYSKLGRESIYDEMRKGAADAGHNLIMSPADNNRIGGWQKMRDMLENARADRPEKPGLWVFETCHHWLRTVPVMQRSDTDFDDVDTTQEDHCSDDTRYVCMTGARQLKIGSLVGR